MKFTLFRFVRVKGLEPPRLSSLDPKSSAATNYATRANPIAKVRIIFKMANILGYIFIKDKEKSLSQFDCERDRLNIGVF